MQVLVIGLVSAFRFGLCHGYLFLGFIGVSDCSTVRYCQPQW